MKWTRTLPDREGAWWVRLDDENTVVVRVVKSVATGWEYGPTVDLAFFIPGVEDMQWVDEWDKTEWSDRPVEYPAESGKNVASSQENTDV